MKLIVDVKDNAEDKDIREAIISATELVDENRVVIEQLREENNLLFIENHRIAEVLLEDGYTIEDVNNISIGKPIDKGGK